MLVFELPTVTLIPNGIHHPPIEDGRLLPNSVKGKTTVETIGNGWEPFVTPDSSNDPKAYAISEKNIVKGQTGVRVLLQSFKSTIR